MEYLDGEPLDALIDRVGNLSLADALPILRPIAKALDAAHAKGIAHRDLKAENIFLGRDSDGQLFPKLLDFGIAKLMGREEALKHKTRTGAPIGTPYYMSPEQCRGKDVDHRTDVYAFGVLVYRMLTGVYPFDGDDYMAILMQQITAEPPPLSTHLPDVPSTINDVVQWLLAKEPSARPADLRTAVHALEQAAIDGGLDIGPVPAWDVHSTQGKAYQTQPPRRTNVVATPIATAPTMAPPAKKSRAPLIGGIAAAVVVIAGIGVFALGGSKHEKKPAPPVETAPVATPVAPMPTPTPPPAPPPEPTSAIITVAGVPEGTEVLVGDKVVGVAPGPVQLDRTTATVVLTFRADGYLPASKSIVPDADKPLDVTLKKKATRGGGKKPGRDDIIDVFGGKK
jgi:serine/threonine-protein kinase